MNRRQLVSLLGGAAVAMLRPLAAQAQQVRRIGALLGGVASASIGQSNLTAFVQGLRKLGWIEGQNLQIEVRWSGGDQSLMQAYATDLVGLFKPDVLLTGTTANLAAVQRATRTIAICRCSCRPSSGSSSTARPRTRSASRCRSACSSPPTR